VRAAIGRMLLLAVMAAAISMHLWPFLMLLSIPAAAGVFVPIEIFAASAYSISRNLMLIAIVETAWFAWIMAAMYPITLKF
jgi:hypothetical protein